MEPTPPRWRSSVPFVNFYYTNEYNDNYWVKLERMPDGETYIAKTDTPDMLEMNFDTLEPQGKLKFEDDLKCIVGATHTKYHNNTDMIGVCSEINTSTGAY